MHGIFSTSVSYQKENALAVYYKEEKNRPNSTSSTKICPNINIKTLYKKQYKTAHFLSRSIY